MLVGNYLSAVVRVLAGTAAGVIGWLLVRRRVGARTLAAHHDDVAGALLSVVGTLYAVLLGLVMVDALKDIENAREATVAEENAVANLLLLVGQLPEPKRGRSVGWRPNPGAGRGGRMAAVGSRLRQRRMDRSLRDRLRPPIEPRDPDGPAGPPSAVAQRGGPHLSGRHPSRGAGQDLRRHEQQLRRLQQHRLLDFYLGTGDPTFLLLVPNRMFLNGNGQRFAEITASAGTGHL